MAELPPLHRYCEHLVFARLARGVDREVARQCRKLPLHDPECRDFLLQTLLSVTSVRVACIPLLASVVSQLSRYQDDLAVDYVDAVLEELVDEVAVCRVQLDAVEARPQRVARRAPVVGEEARDFVERERARRCVRAAAAVHARAPGRILHEHSTGTSLASPLPDRSASYVICPHGSVITRERGQTPAECQRRRAP